LAEILFDIGTKLTIYVTLPLLVIAVVVWLVVRGRGE